MKKYDIINENTRKIKIDQFVYVNEVRRESAWIHHSHKTIPDKNKYYYTILYLTEGSYISKYDDCEFMQKKGALIIINSKQGMNCVNTSKDLPTHYFSINFTLDNPIDEVYFNHFRSIVFPENNLKVEELFKVAYSLYYNKPEVWELEIKSIILRLLVIFFKEFHSIKIKNGIPEDIFKAVKYIDDNIFNKDISVCELAQSINVSVEHFTRKFTKSMGISPKKYILELKLKRAAFFLINTNKNIAEICENVRFCSLAYFNKLFLEKYNITPFQYRKNNREINL